MVARLLKSPRFWFAVLIVAVASILIIPGMIAGTPCYEIFLNTPPMPPDDQANWVIEVFNWQAAYGKPWEWEKPDAHLADVTPQWWDNNAKYGTKFWVELDKVLVVFNYNKITGEYVLIGMAVTLGDPVKQEAHDMDVWVKALVQGGDGSYTAGTFKWLGADKAKEVIDQLVGTQPVTEDRVKQTASWVTT